MLCVHISNSVHELGVLFLGAISPTTMEAHPAVERCLARAGLELATPSIPVDENWFFACERHMLMEQPSQRSVLLAAKFASHLIPDNVLAQNVRNVCLLYIAAVNGDSVLLDRILEYNVAKSVLNMAVVGAIKHNRKEVLQTLLTFVNPSKYLRHAQELGRKEILKILEWHCQLS